MHAHNIKSLYRPPPLAPPFYHLLATLGQDTRRCQKAMHVAQHISALTTIISLIDFDVRVRPSPSILLGLPRLTDSRLGRIMSMEMLPDDVLLEIFDCYMVEGLRTQKGVEVWRTLVHVCRRWRSLVFGSPRNLKLRLVCTYQTPTRKTLGVWPALPLIIQGHASRFVVDDLIAALEHRDRVCKIDLRYYSSESASLRATMQEPFPELTYLYLEARSRGEPGQWTFLPRPDAQDFSDSFLGGSAPRPRFIWMNDTRFQGLRKLLLSATHLVDLHLIDISDHPSSQRMATCVSVLTSLQTLELSFQNNYPPYQENQHPTRVVLPALRYFHFTGNTDYLESLVARIDTPELNKLSIMFNIMFNQRVTDSPELARFVGRMPKLGVPYEARLAFYAFEIAIVVRLPSQIFGDELLKVEFTSEDSPFIEEESDSRRISCVARVCASLSPTVSTVENLYIYVAPFSEIYSYEYTESTRWLELFRSFIALKNLYLDKEFSQRIASALEDLDEGSITELLPSLQNIFVRGLQPPGHIDEGIRRFIASRRLIGHSITVSIWDIKFDKTWE